MKKYKVLIAHQSTIPHYRIDFFESLHEVLPKNVDFEVVEERKQSKRDLFFKEEKDLESVKFKIHYTNTYFLSKKSKYCFQTFIFQAWKYDLLIVENAVNNLSYILIMLFRLFGKKVSFWGHGRDLNHPDDTSRTRQILESFKFWLVRRASSYFAYTESVKKYLIQRQIPSQRVFNLSNTLDIVSIRNEFERVNDSLENVALTKKLVFTGRLTKSKRIGFLLEAFQELYNRDNEFELNIIGDGPAKYKDLIRKKSDSCNIKYHGEITNNIELAKIYAQCDIYMYPGYIGLGGVHAMCFDLIPVVIDHEFHKPEYDYLNHGNSVITSKGSNALEYSDAIIELYKDPTSLILKKSNVWPSISHLTVENMAKNFSEGILKTLG